MNEMKNILILISLLATTSLSAQILPVEDLNEVTGNIPEQITGIRHIKDVNGVLNIYVGIWKGTFNGKTLELVIKKYTRDHSLYVQDYHPEPLLWDELIAKYKIVGQHGETIENTLDMSNDSLELTMKHRFYDLTTYTFNYYGKNHMCGDNGILFLWYKNDNTIDLKYSFKGATYSNCTRRAEKSLPSDTTIVLTKQ